jgi:hypothetical protein
MTEEYGAEKASHVHQLLSDLSIAKVGGFEKYVSKLERALGTGSEFAGTLREGVYARFLSRAGGKPTFEPKGNKGPDLGIDVREAHANLEIKRLLEGEATKRDSDLETWHRDETEEDFEPGGADRLTDKVLGVITDAARQLVPGEPNVVILSDWTLGVTRGNFRRAMELLSAEVAENGTYGKITAIQYDSNFLGATNAYLWINPGADVPLPDEIAAVLGAASSLKADASNEVLQRAMREDLDEN